MSAPEYCPDCAPEYCPDCGESPRRVFISDWAEHHLCGATREQLAALADLVEDTLRLIEGAR